MLKKNTKPVSKLVGVAVLTPPPQIITVSWFSEGWCRDGHQSSSDIQPKIVYVR